MLDYKLVSCDDHMDMDAWPPTLFTDRLPSKYRGRAPKVVETPDGSFWQVEGRISGHSGVPKTYPSPNAIARAGIENNGFRPSTPELRLQDMDLDGIYATVVYGPPRFAQIDDADLLLQCQKVFNDWAVEFNSYDPDRLSVLAYLPLQTSEICADEYRRIADKGHKGAVFGFVEAPKPVHDPSWEVVWQAAEETGLPMSFHISGGLSTLTPQPNSWVTAATSSCWPKNLDEPLASMMFSGALERHPNMTLVLGESGLGWIPYMIERMDLAYGKYYDSIQDFRLSHKPSEIFRRQVYVTFEAEEDVGMRLIPDIGVDRVMWASDYPHPDSTFPNSRKLAEEMFPKHGLDEIVTRKICQETAASLYGIGTALN